MARLEGSVSIGECDTSCLYIDETLDHMPLLDAFSRECAAKHAQGPSQGASQNPSTTPRTPKKSATETDREEVRRTRSACKNGLEFVGKMLMKRELWQLLVKIGAVSRFV